MSRYTILRSPQDFSVAERLMKTDPLVRHRRTDYHGTRFEGVKIDDMSNCNLRGAYFFFVKAHGANFRGADLTDATIDGDFTGADLTGASLLGADYRQMRLRGAVLDKCLLPDGRLYHEYVRDFLPRFLLLVNEANAQLCQAYEEDWLTHDSPDGSVKTCTCTERPGRWNDMVRLFVWLFDQGLLPQGGVKATYQRV